MLSPTTLTFSVLVLVLSDRPLRNGAWFYLGAFGATLGIGIVAAFVIGDVASDPTPSTPKTWVAVLDVLLGLGLLTFLVIRLRRTLDRAKVAGMTAQMEKVAFSPAVGIVGAGAGMAEGGGVCRVGLTDS